MAIYWAEKTGLKQMLEKFLKNGGLYAGESAGVVCQIKDLEAIKWLDKPDKAPKVVTEGMQLTDIVVLPHWGIPKYQLVLEKIKTYYENLGLSPYLLQDGKALIIDGNNNELIPKTNT